MVEVNEDLKEAIEFSCEDNGSCCNYAIYRYIVIEDCGLYEFKTEDEIILIETVGVGMFKDITKKIGTGGNIKDIITEWKDKIIL